MMNTKYNSSATGPVPRALGKPVGVLPLGPQSAVNIGQRRASSIERRRLRKTPSTDTLGSARSVLSNTSASSLVEDVTHNKSQRVSSGKKKREQRFSEPRVPPLDINRKQRRPPPRNISRVQKASPNAGLVNGNKYNRDASETQTAEEDYDSDNLSCEGQDVKFFDVQPSSRINSSQSTRSDVAPKSITTQDILDRSQEAEPYRVYQIDLHGEDLTEAPDLEKFRKCRALDLSGNHITRIDGIDFMRELKELKLYDNAIKTIDGLDNVKELCHLQLQHNQIQKIGNGLKALKKLQILRLDNNKLSKIETPELLSCSNITTLDLSRNCLESLTPLNYLPNLEELFASGNCLKSVGDLSKCRKLQEVDLSWNRLGDLTGLANLPNIQIIDLSHNSITSLKSIGKLKALEELNINANRVTQLSSFSCVFPKLQILFVCDNMISSWDEVCSLEDLPDLVELSLSANPVTLDDGEMPAYVTAATVALPNLEVIDGALVKRGGKQAAAAPVMRPMSAASVISVRQVDTQLKASSAEQEDFHKNIADRFTSLRSLFDTLPSQAPSSSSRGISTATSRCSSRSRLKEARDFAAYNFDNEDEEL